MLRVFSSAIAMGSLAALALSSAAVAQDAPNWTGFNVSVGGGVSRTDIDLGVDAEYEKTLGLNYFFWQPLLLYIGKAAGHSDLGDEEWQGFGTLQGGYDQRVGDLVFGGFANFDFYPDGTSGGSDGIDGFLVTSAHPFYWPHKIPIADKISVTSNIELKNTWSIGGRLGMLLTPNFLLYGVGGYTEAKLDGKVDLVFPHFTKGTETLTLVLPDELRGYFLGGGGEFKIDNNIALRLEYRYANYRGKSASTSTSYIDNHHYPFYVYHYAAGLKADLDADIHTVRGAIVLHLGTP